MERSAGSSHRRTTLYATVGSGALFAGALTYVGLVDPHRAGSLFPACPFKLVTGWDCPACGGLRMTHDLLHGDVAAAVVDNVFLLVGLPALLAWVLLRRSQGRRVMTTPVITLLAVSAVTWTVVRNLPGFPLVPTLLSG
ncbi:DUF2752 domain-containing protein [soil metagenome]